MNIANKQDALDYIKNYDILASSLDEFMEMVRSIWWHPSLIEQKGDKWHVSTGGWSDNEKIIDAMRGNTIFWFLYWEQSRRGGHYIFSKQNY